MDGEPLAVLQRQRGDALAEDAPLDVVRNLRLDLAVLDQLHDVPAAQPVRNRDLARQRAGGGRGRVAERDRDERPAGAGAVDAVADDGRPLHVHRRVRRQTARRDVDLRVDRARRRGELCARRRRGREARQLQRRLRVERRRDVLRPVQLRLRPAVVRRDVELELLAGAPRDRRLLDVQVLEADRVGDLDRCEPTGPSRGCAPPRCRASSSPSSRRRSGCRTGATRRPRTATSRARCR